MSWPTCVICHAVIPAADQPRHACVGCETRLRDQLAYLATALVDLPHCLVPEHSGDSGGRSSARVEAPLPLRLDVVSLLGGGGIRDVLGGWAREWIEARRGDPLPGTPDPAGDALRWACRHHPAIGEYAIDVGELYADARDALTDREPAVVGQCRQPGCGGQLLAVERPAGDAECDTCGSRITPDGLPAAIAARRVGVRPSTLTTWHGRGWLAHAPGSTARRVLYLTADLDTARTRSRAARGPLRAPRVAPAGDRPRVLVGTYAVADAAMA